MNGFYNRIESIAKHYNYNSVNDLALSALAYKSSEKLNRLKNYDNAPSVKIILDISNKFEKINTNWLLTGNGKMFIEETASNTVSEPYNAYNKVYSLEDFSSLEIVEHIYRNKDRFYGLKSFRELIKHAPEDEKIEDLEKMFIELKDLKMKMKNLLSKK